MDERLPSSCIFKFLYPNYNDLISKFYTYVQHLPWLALLASLSDISYYVTYSFWDLKDFQSHDDALEVSIANFYFFMLSHILILFSSASQTQSSYYLLTADSLDLMSFFVCFSLLLSPGLDCSHHIHLVNQL